MAYRILIVEDDDFLRSLAVSKLEKDGFVMETASTGDEGLTKVLQLPPDLLILDLMLPNISGFDILKKIRETDPVKQLKVVVFSNLGEESDIKQCLDLGVSEYLIKSNFTLDELAEKIKAIIGK
jgi:DNA-binding response OmpR family regulator